MRLRGTAGGRALYTISQALVVAVMLVATGAPPARAESARAILDRRKALEDGERKWTDRFQQMRMRITGSAGLRERELDVYERRYPNDELRATVFLRATADVRNVAFLSISKKSEAADQWLYLPALKRVRQITVSTRNEPFVSSDLTFHDLDLLSEMTNWSEADARSTLRADERIGEASCFTIELQPQRDDIGYRRIVLWLARDDLVPRQIELYTEAAAGGWFGLGGGASGGEPTKRIRQSRVEASGKIHVPRRIEVETPAKGSRTEIDVVAVAHDHGLPDSLFTQRALELGPDAVGRRQ